MTFFTSKFRGFVMGMQESNIDCGVGLTRKGLRFVASEEALRAADDSQVRGEYMRRQLSEKELGVLGELANQRDLARSALNAIRRGDIHDAESCLDILLSASTAAMRGSW